MRPVIRSQTNVVLDSNDILDSRSKIGSNLSSQGLYALNTRLLTRNIRHLLGRMMGTFQEPEVSRTRCYTHTGLVPLINTSSQQIVGIRVCQGLFRVRHAVFALERNPITGSPRIMRKGDFHLTAEKSTDKTWMVWERTEYRELLRRWEMDDIKIRA